MTHMRLAGKVALVTGASSGIGAACAVRLATEGATVAGLDMAAPHGSVRDCLESVHDADVRDEDAVEAVVRTVAERSGRLDVLVNAAGVAGGAPVHLLPAEEWDRVVGVNLKGTYLVSKHALRPMMEQRSGSIVNLASIEGLEGIDVASAYNASKGGVVLLTRQMAVDYGRLGIRVNCLCPGIIETPMTQGLRGEGMESFREAMADAHLLGRFGKPEEVAAAAAFLASDDASFVTGHALVVDGGMTAGHRFGLGTAFGLG